MTTPIHEPTNVQRAQWAKAALAVFTAETYGDDLESIHPDDMETAISDLICDLLHFARFHPKMDAAAIHAHALRLFEQEIAEEEACDCGGRSWRGPHHDSQCPVGRCAAPPRAPSATELLDALDCLAGSLSPRKVASVLKAAGYSTDIWLAAHRHARVLIATAKKTLTFTGGRHA